MSKASERVKAWRIANPGRRNKSDAARRSRNRDKFNEQSREYKVQNYEKVKKNQERSRLLTSYGITPEDRDRMHEEQNNLCKICGKEETATQSGKIRRLSIDHCHKTGAIRGLLCVTCNLGLGNFQDNIEILYKAIEYLTSQQLDSQILAAYSVEV